MARKRFDRRPACHPVRDPVAVGAQNRKVLEPRDGFASAERSSPLVIQDLVEEPLDDATQRDEERTAVIHILNRITEHLLVDKWADCFRCSGASNAVPGRRQLATAGRSDISRVASAYAFLVQPPIRDRSPGSTVVAPLDAKDLRRLANAHALWIYDGARRTRTADLLVRSYGHQYDNRIRPG